MQPTNMSQASKQPRNQTAKQPSSQATYQTSASKRPTNLNRPPLVLWSPFQKKNLEEYIEVDLHFSAPVYVNSCQQRQAMYVAEALRCASCPAACTLSAAFSRFPYVPVARQWLEFSPPPVKLFLGLLCRDVNDLWAPGQDRLPCAPGLLVILERWSSQLLSGVLPSIKQEGGRRSIAIPISCNIGGLSRFDLGSSTFSVSCHFSRGCCRQLSS